MVAGDVRSVLDSLVAQGKAPGLQYLFTDATRRFEHVAGNARFDPDRPVDPATTFNAYSVSKVFTACAMLMAAQQGRLDLDASIETLLGPWVPRGFGTVRETLLHRAGFPNPNPLRWVHADAAHAGFDEEVFARRLAAGLRPPAHVGDRYRYSNVGYLMLGRALEAATGESLPAFVERHLIAPLKLSPSEYLGYSIPDTDQHARGYMRRLSALNLALGFMVDRDSLIGRRAGPWEEFRLHHVDGAAYGGLIANARGLVRFGQALMDSSGSLPARVREAMLAGVPGPGPARSPGWFSGQLEGVRWFAHAGGGPAYYCELRVYPGRAAVSAIMLNRPGLSDARLLDRIDPVMLST